MGALPWVSENGRNFVFFVCSSDGEQQDEWGMKMFNETLQKKWSAVLNQVYLCW